MSDKDDFSYDDEVAVAYDYMNDDSIDDLEKQRLKRVDNITKTVVDGYSNELMKLNLLKLEERRDKLITTIEDPEKNSHTRSTARLQLKLVNESIQELWENIDWDLEYDTDVDEDAARKFIKENNLLEDDSMMHQNDVLDEMEKNLYKKGDD